MTFRLHRLLPQALLGACLLSLAAPASSQRLLAERLEQELSDSELSGPQRLDLLLRRARALMSWNVPAAREAALEAQEEARRQGRRDYLALGMALEARLVSMLTGSAEATALMRRAHETMPADAAVGLRGQLAVIEVGLLYMIDEYGLAAESLELALRLAEQADSRELMADCLLELHDLFYVTSTGHEPAADLRRAEELLTELGDERGLLRVRLRWVDIWEQQGRESEVQRALAELVEAGERTGDRSALLAARSARYSNALERGRYDEALALAEGSIRISRELGSRELLAWNLDHLAWAYLQAGRAEEAAPHLVEALAIAEELDLRVLLTAVVDSAAELAIARGDGEALLENSLRRRRLAEEGLGRETRDEALARSVLSELRSERREAHDAAVRREEAMAEARQEYEAQVTRGRWIGAGVLLLLISIASALLYRDKRRAEQMHARLVEQTELARRVQEARDRLEREVAELERLDGLGLLSAGIAHDFNNILCAISGNAELLLEEREGEERQMVESILQSSRRAADLCRRLMDYARPSPENREVTDLNDLMADVRTLLEAGKRGPAELRVELGSEPLPAEVDRSAIEQVVINLATNALDASVQAQAVVLRARTVEDPDEDEGGVFFGRPASSHAYAVLEVCDDGVGLSAELVRRVFDPFFTTKFEGRGLGLPAAHGIVRAHGGGFRVTSAPNRGTTFAAYLPLSESEAAEREVTLSPRSPRLGQVPGSGILAVDDEAGILSYVQNALSGSGQEVYVASSAHEAGRVLDQHAASIGVVLLDLSMPEMDGSEFLAVVRRKHGDLPVVVMSGHEESFVRDRLGDAESALPILRKPFGRAELFEALEAALGAAPRRAEPTGPTGPLAARSASPPAST